MCCFLSQVKVGRYLRRSAQCQFLAITWLKGRTTGRCRMKWRCGNKNGRLRYFLRGISGVHANWHNPPQRCCGHAAYFWINGVS